MPNICICLATGIASVITTIVQCLHLSYKIDTNLIAKNLTLVNVTIYCMMNDFSNNVLSSTDM